MYVFMYACSVVCLFVCLFDCLCVCVFVCLFRCLYVCQDGCMHAWNYICLTCFFAAMLFALASNGFPIVFQWGFFLRILLHTWFPIISQISEFVPLKDPARKAFKSIISIGVWILFQRCFPIGKIPNP